VKDKGYSMGSTLQQISIHSMHCMLHGRLDFGAFLLLDTTSKPSGCLPHALFCINVPMGVTMPAILGNDIPPPPLAIGSVGVTFEHNI
jgi:hypothetical protein